MTPTSDDNQIPLLTIADKESVVSIQNDPDKGSTLFGFFKFPISNE